MRDRSGVDSIDVATQLRWCLCRPVLLGILKHIHLMLVMMANEAFEALNLPGIKRELETQLPVGSIKLFSVIILPTADVLEDDVREST